MKKLLIVSLIVTSLIGANITFAQPTVPDSVEMAQELVRIKNDLNIAFHNALRPGSDKSTLTQDINFIKTRLDSLSTRVNALNKPEQNLLKKESMKLLNI